MNQNTIHCPCGCTYWTPAWQEAQNRARSVQAAHWSVSVDRNGENLVTIESNCLSGKPEFSDDERLCIRNCAEHLLALVGTGESTIIP